MALILADVPEPARKLVTGHRSLGYFADRYGFELIGTVIPSLSTSGEPTAREMAQLIEDIKANDVTAVFTEVGTPQSVAQAVASTVVPSWSRSRPRSCRPMAPTRTSSAPSPAAWRRPWRRKRADMLG